MALEVGRGVDDQGETGGVTFGKAVEGERRDLPDDLFLSRSRDAPFGHASAKPDLDVLHPFDRAFEPHGATQFFGLAAGKTRRRHGDPQELFLKERHAQSPFEDRFQTGMGIGDGFAPHAPLQVGAGHLAGDRARPDDRHLDDEVVETFGPVARQGGHLGATLDLEDPRGVGATDHCVGLRVVGRQVSQVDVDAFRRTDHRDHILERRQHAQTQQIDLDQPEVGAVVLVPLDDRSTLHGGGFQRNDLIEASPGDDHAARVLPEMTRKVVDFFPQAFEQPDAPGPGIEAQCPEFGVEVPFSSVELPRRPAAESL